MRLASGFRVWGVTGFRVSSLREIKGSRKLDRVIIGGLRS